MYHLHVKNIGRRNKRSAVAAAAYRAGEVLPNDAEEKESAFGGRRDVVFTEIRCPEGAPAWMADRAKLWNAVEAAEKRKDSRLAKEIEFSLPRQLPASVWVEVARQMADVYVSKGHVVDLAIHEDGSNHNPHCHLMLATRAVGPEGFGGKLREADGVAFVNEARSTWEAIANVALGKVGSEVQIDARSHAARGIDRPPTTHRGPDRAERLAKRIVRSRPMDHDTLEARRELLAEPTAREMFPQLSARPDWPPEVRQPIGGLTPAELGEWQQFWRTVDERRWGPELMPDAPRSPEFDGARPIVEGRPDPAMDKARAKLVEGVERDAATREATLEDALPVWRELHEAMVERMRADGWNTDHPLHDWSRVEKALREMDQRLTVLRSEEVTRQLMERRDEPVPDPDGRPIHPRELDDAQERLIIETARPAGRVPKPPPPGQMPPAGRADARAAVERQNALPVSDREADDYRLAPHESRLDWMDAVPTSRAPEAQREDRLDWLGDHQPGHDRNREPDRERDR
jgi:hypothetical protein